MAQTAETISRTGTAVLEIEDLRVEVEGKEILKGIDLVVRQGEVHALMGPNGSGKSTLAQVLMGRTSYKLTGGKIRFKGDDVTKWTPDKRAQHGLFLAFQYPTEIAGVSVVNFLRSAYKAVKGDQISALAFRKRLKEKMNLLGVEDQMVNRYVNQGFSGGEKKKNEVLQLAVLEPDIAILDETDSGLDIDSLKAVTSGAIRSGAPCDCGWIDRDGHCARRGLPRRGTKISIQDMRTRHSVARPWQAGACPSGI